MSVLPGHMNTRLVLITIALLYIISLVKFGFTSDWQHISIVQSVLNNQAKTQQDTVSETPSHQTPDHGEENPTGSQTYLDRIESPPSFVRPELSHQEREEMCKSKKLEINPGYAKTKVYDLFLAGSELDWLEIRLSELAPVVDYFVIVESSKTFTFKPKPLHFKENYEKFHQFAPKIIYRALDLAGLENNSTWEREKYQRNQLFDVVFPSLNGEQAPAMGDILMVSDLDEIPRPETIETLRSCKIPERVTLQSNFYYYSFQWLHGESDWFHPQATYFQGFENTIRPQSLRMDPAVFDLVNASWHCSNCFKTVAEMKHKIESFSHTEFDLPKFKDPAHIVDRVRHGKDLYDRNGQKFSRVDNNMDIPKYLLQHASSFAYMLDRDAENANFADYNV